jgi:hypothetical protein
MTEITVFVPDAIGNHAFALANFFQGMINKLHKNRHKDAITLPDIPMLMELLRGEIVEFEEQLGMDKFDTNTLVELMDVANFAYLAYGALVREGVGNGKQPNSTGYTPTVR